MFLILIVLIKEQGGLWEGRFKPTLVDQERNKKIFLKTGAKTKKKTDAFKYLL